MIYEDDHLLVVNKPAGMNTHAPSPYAGEGLYEWLRDREPRWANLAIIHRLDKETSGVIVFSKTKETNRDLTRQFEGRHVSKTYRFLTSGKATKNQFTVKDCLVRAGERYVSRPLHAGGTVADTLFRFRATAQSGIQEPQARSGDLITEWEAEPRTGRTHQIRVHAAKSGIPILGDVLYGGAPASRVCLHAAEIRFRHPATHAPLIFNSDPEFNQNARTRLREAIIDPAETDCYRIEHGAADGQRGWYVDRFGEYLLSQAEKELTPDQIRELERLMRAYSARGAYHKLLCRSAEGRTAQEFNAKPVLGEAAPDRFLIRENGLKFELSFNEGYSVGIFLDQRDNRRRVLRGYVSAGFSLFAPEQNLEVLNAFSYTCAFSVGGAKTGARVTSLDLSKKYLDWGKRNFELNKLDPNNHDFIYGDVFDWLPRLAKKGRRFDLVLLDPPTFSRSKVTGTFRAEKAYGKLVTTALALVKSNGVLFCSCNTAKWEPQGFVETVRGAVKTAGRKLLQEKYYPQPPDFPISREEPGYLKTMWLRLE